MKAVVAAFNQEKALVGAFSVITNLRMELFEALLGTEMKGPCRDGVVIFEVLSAGHEALFLGGMWTRRRGDNCQESGVPGVTGRETTATVTLLADI